MAVSLLIASGSSNLLQAAPQAGGDATVPGIGLAECLHRVVDYNQTLQIHALEWLAARKRYKATKGVFEPALVSSAEHVKNFRKTVAEQRISLGVPEFDERNNLYDAGVDFLVPTGAKVHLGYTLHDLSNNLQQQVTGGLKEFESFAGLSLTQPLLKDGGIATTLAAIRIAAAESEIAFQDYRRQMIVIIARTEGAYWDLYDAQQQYQIRTQSVNIARTILRDYQVRLQTGKASELDVMQAQAGLAARAARSADARQKLAEAINDLVGLFTDPDQLGRRRVRASDQPRVRPETLDYGADMTVALDMNPDYLSQRHQVVEEGIRLAYAKNQRWPQLDLKASYGLNGLGATWSSSWNDINQANFENWSVGVELRIPLLGGIKSRNELAAAKLKKQEAILGLKNTEVTIGKALDSALDRIANAQASVANYRQVVAFDQHLLETELARMHAGKTDSRRILEVEDELAQARSTLVDVLVAYEKARVDRQIVEGTALRDWRLELSRQQLLAKTANVLEGGKWEAWEYDAFNQ